MGLRPAWVHQLLCSRSNPLRAFERRDHVTRRVTKQRGKVGWLLLWLVGVPVPVLLFLFLIRGCT